MKAVCIISWTMNYQVQCDSFQIWFASLHLTVRECVFPRGHTHAPMPFFLTLGPGLIGNIPNQFKIPR